MAPLGGFGGFGSGALPVSVERSLTLDAVIACLRVLAESIGCLPLKTYTRAASGRGRIEALTDPVYSLLHDEPNPEMTAVETWSQVVVGCNTWGNAYLGKNRVPDRTSPTGWRVEALWPLAPETVRVFRERGVKTYEVTDPNGPTRRFTDDEIIHVRGISLDGLVGLSPIALARTAIGRGLASDDFAAAFYRNSAIPRGVLELDGEIDVADAERLREQWQELYGGAAAHRVAILEAGVHFKPITLPMEDAQFVETERLTVQKIARIFRVPASMIGGSTGDSLTYSTVEGDALHFERYSLRPWIVRIEQALARDRDLFPREGRATYPEFVTDAILRADTKTRYEAHAIALDPVTGWMRRDEVRSLENLPPEAEASLAVLERQAARMLGAAAAPAAEPEAEAEAGDLSPLDMGLALQRLGAAAKLYGVISADEARGIVGITGPAPAPADGEASADPGPEDAEAAAAAHTNGGAIHA